MNERVRILQVVTHMNRGGLETMLMNYYRQVDRTKVQFDFLTHREYDGDYGEEIKRLGGIIYHLPVLNPFGIRYRKALNEFFGAHSEYKIVHVHQDCMSSIILKSAMKHGIQCRIAHSHCASQDRNVKYPIKMFYQRFIPRYATSLFACGENAGNWMFRGEPFSVLKNAINARNYVFDPSKRLQQRSDFGIELNELVLGHVGRFSPPKNHLFLLDIFYEVQKKVPAKLMLVGDGELRKEIEDKIADLGLGNKVIMTGVRSDVSDLLQAMDVFVFPSNYEGLPVAMIEAQVSGLQCLISDRVPIECKMTDLVQQIPLSCGVETWAKRVVNVSDYSRKDTYVDIALAGFDIEENAKRLQDYYQRSANGEINNCVF